MATQIEEICPHLGSEKDQLTIFNYPSQRNICYRAKGTSIPKLDHQRSTCLTAKYLDCPVYTGAEMKRMPKHLSIRRGGFFLKPKTIIRAIFIILFITALLIAILFLWT